MRKFFTMMISITLCITMLAGCGSRDAYNLYQRMNSAMADVTSMDADMTINMQMRMDGESIDMIMGGNVRTVVHSDTDIDMHMVLTTTIMEEGFNESFTITAYFTDGILYMEMPPFEIEGMEIDGIRMQQPMDLDEAMDMSNNIETLNFPENAVLESSVESISGGRRLEMLVDGDAIPDITEQMMAFMPDDMGLGHMDFDMSIGDIRIEVDVDNNNMLMSYRMVTDMTMEMYGYLTETTLDMTMTVNSFDDVVINFPDDLDDFPVMDGFGF